GGFASTFVDARSAGDPAGTMQGAKLVTAGKGTGNIVDRAGDFSGMNVDPGNGTFWAANQVGVGGNPRNAIAELLALPAGGTVVGGTLTISGNQVRIVRESADPTLLDIFINNASSVPTSVVIYTGLTQINVTGTGVNPSLTVDESNGKITSPISYTGGG